MGCALVGSWSEFSIRRASHSERFEENQPRRLPGTRRSSSCTFTAARQCSIAPALALPVVTPRDTPILRAEEKKEIQRDKSGEADRGC